MKSKILRCAWLAAALAVVAACQNTMSTGDYVALRESYDYQGPNAGFYNSWYGAGAYVGAGGYGGVGVGISVPIVQ